MQAANPKAELWVVQGTPRAQSVSLSSGAAFSAAATSDSAPFTSPVTKSESARFARRPGSVGFKRIAARTSFTASAPLDSARHSPARSRITSDCLSFNSYARLNWA